MLTVYSSQNCTSSIKTKRWLEKNNVDFIEKSIAPQSMKSKDIKLLLRMIEDGPSELLNIYYKNIYCEFINHLNINELKFFLNDKPYVIQTPILVDEFRIVTGYNEFELLRFLPKRIERFDLASI
ncbi:ArsC/Spx/MgsR family protein [Candidatus Enterococcus lemimoniae]|uniref:ArsC/Spx/MgsR family protein n=1 Tax=Candidatus Enterococcus lemimoniae TaxID=1834167 RepID=UPI003BAE5F78